MMKSEKRRAPPTAIAVSVNSLYENHLDYIMLDEKTICLIPANEDIHESAKDEDEEASVQCGSNVGKVSLGLNEIIVM